MDTINKVLRIASRRLWFNGFTTALVWFASIALVLAILARLTQQAIAIEIPWLDASLYAAGAIVVLAALWSFVLRAKPLTVARRVDEGAGLKETLSTALCVKDQPDPWSRAAVSEAADRSKRVPVRAAVPLRMPGLLPMVPALAVALLVIWITVPAGDLLGLREQQLAKDEEDRQVKEINATVKQMDDVEKLVERLNPEQIDPREEAAGDFKPATPEEAQRAAIKKATDLKTKLASLRKSDRAQKIKLTQDMLKNLKPVEGDLNKLSTSLANSDFKAAAAELEKLQQKIESGDLDEQQAQQLQDQLNNLANQLNQAAQNQQQLQQQLQDAGIDPNLANNPQALQQALQQANNLTPQQKQQLQNQAQACQNAGGACQNLAQGMGQLAQSMMQQAGQQGQGQQGNSGGGQQAMQNMQGQLSELEMLQQEMNQVDAAMQQVQQQIAQVNQACQGQGQGQGQGQQDGQGSGSSSLAQGNQPGSWSQGDPANKPGSGSGGPGQGNGPTAGAEDAPYTSTTEHNPGVIGPGPTIASRLVEGDSIMNEAQAEFDDAVQVATEAATEAIEHNEIPAEYQDPVKVYYNRLRGHTSSGKPVEDAASGEEKDTESSDSDSTSDQTSGTESENSDENTSDG